MTNFRTLDDALDALTNLRTACQEAVKVLAAAILRAPEIEAKMAMGRHLHRLADAARRLDQRIGALAGPEEDEVSVARSADGSLLAELGSASRQHATRGFIRSFYDGFATSLECSFHDYLVASHPVWDEPSRVEVRTSIAALKAIADERRRLGVKLDEVFPSDASVEIEHAPGDRIDLAYPEQPARDRRFVLTDRLERINASSPVEKTIVDMHVNLMALEIPTIEACCRNILDFVGMPSEFTFDMARQIWDEVRHAESCYARMIELGGTIGRYPADLKLWNIATGMGLAMRLAIHQRCGESIGVDAALFSVSDYRARGDLVTATLYEFLARDEIEHVAIGNKWIAWLTNDADSASIHTAAVARRAEFGDATDGLRPFPVIRWAQLKAGFKEDEVDGFRERGASTSTG